MSAFTFNTISGEDWKNFFAKFRSEGLQNEVASQIHFAFERERLEKQLEFQAITENQTSRCVQFELDRIS